MSNLRAIGLVLASMVFWSTQDVFVKFVAEDVSLWQLQLIRSMAVIGLLVLLLTALGNLPDLLPRRWRWPMVRGLLHSISYLGFYASLPYISLAKAASAFFSSPIMITVLAALFLGEGIGPRRIAAVFVGFAGVLLIVQPGLEGWQPATLLPLGSALAYASAVVLTRWRCRDDPGYSLTMVANLTNLVVGGLGLLIVPMLVFSSETRAEHMFVLEGWLPIGGIVLALCVATAATHIAGSLCSVKAYQIGEASRLAPFEYTYLVLMAAYGFAIWGTVPETATLAGMTLIIASGGFIAWREGRPPRPRVQQSAEIPWTPEHLDEEPSMPPDYEGAPSRNW